jgi:hypothetical protein
VRLAEALPPISLLSVEVTSLVVLTLRPRVVPLTSTVTVQVPLGAMVPPEKATEVLPAAGAKVGDPQPVFDLQNGTRLQRRFPGVPASFPVVRMQPLCPTEAEFSIHGAASEV